MQAEAAELGITPARLRRAREQLQVTVRRSGYSSDGAWVWALPSAEEEEQAG